MLKLPVGFNYNKTAVKTLKLAETSGEAEKVFVKRPGKTELYTWFSEIIAVAVESVQDVRVASEFIKSGVVPSVIKKIPLVDAGSLLLQIHIEAWQDTMGEQELICKYCGHIFERDIDLKKIEIPFDENDEIPEFIDVVLDKTYEINADGVEKFADIHGMKYNMIRYRVPLLGDGIANEGLASDEVEFWRNISFTCQEGLYFVEKGENGYAIVDSIPSEYAMGMGKRLYNSTFTTKSLKLIREKLQTSLKSAPLYYRDKCPSCNRLTPHIAAVENFFSA